MPLTAFAARAVIGAAEARALEIGVPVAIVVVDAGAHLKAFSRMDHAVLGASDIATKKARTSVLLACPSEDVWEYCRPGGPAPGLELTNGGLAPFAGGIPLTAGDGTLCGAVGVSGGTVAQDLEIAQAAVAGFPAESSVA